MMLKSHVAHALIFLAVAHSSAFAKTPSEVEVGGALRDVKMNGLSVSPKQLSAFLGKPLIINVWASWCGPCRMEMPALDRLARRYGGKQFNLIGISTDDNMEAAYVFLEKTGISFENFIDKKLVLENMLGADRLPLTLLIDAQGRVLSKHYGAKDWESKEMKQLIEQTLKIKM